MIHQDNPRLEPGLQTDADGNFKEALNGSLTEDERNTLTEQAKAAQAVHNVEHDEDAQKAEDSEFKNKGNAGTNFAVSYINIYRGGWFNIGQ